MTASLIVIGGGPAGMSAAVAAANRGVHTVLLDEAPVLGGRLPGQLHEEYDGGGRGGPKEKPEWWNGREEAARLVAAVDDAGVEVRTSTVVWGTNAKHQVFVHNQAADAQLVDGSALPVERLEADAVVVATGGLQQPVVFPGWTLPGVITVGGAQRLLLDYVRPGHRVLVVGANTLGFAVLHQLRLVGVEVVGVVLPPRNAMNVSHGEPRHVLGELGRLSQLAPSRVLQNLGRFLRGGLASEVGVRLFPRQGVRVWDTPVMLRTALLGVVGDESVSGAIVADIDVDGAVTGNQRELEVDAVITSGGLSPLVELVQLVGGELTFETELGGWVPLHGPNLQTTVSGLYVAGNITGIEGAPVAMAQGTLAGLAAAAYVGAVDAHAADGLLAQAREQVNDARLHSALQFFAGAAEAGKRIQQYWKEKC